VSEEKDKKSKRKKDEKDIDMSNFLDLKIFGMNIGDLLQDVDGLREKLLAQRDELQRKLGDKVRIDVGFKVSGLGEHKIISSNSLWNDLARERTEWRKRIPTVTITKEDIEKAKEEEKKRKREEKDN